MVASVQGLVLPLAGTPLTVQVAAAALVLAALRSGRGERLEVTVTTVAMPSGLDLFLLAAVAVALVK